jgi:hypothetical protein
LPFFSAHAWKRSIAVQGKAAAFAVQGKAAAFFRPEA